MITALPMTIALFPIFATGPETLLFGLMQFVTLIIVI